MKPRWRWVKAERRLGQTGADTDTHVPGSSAWTKEERTAFSVNVRAQPDT